MLQYSFSPMLESGLLSNKKKIILIYIFSLYFISVHQIPCRYTTTYWLWSLEFLTGTQNLPGSKPNLAFLLLPKPISLSCNLNFCKTYYHTPRVLLTLTSNQWPNWPNSLPTVSLPLFLYPVICFPHSSQSNLNKHTSWKPTIVSYW